MSIVAIAGQTFPLRVELESQAAAGTFKSSPTLAVGDVKILALPATPAGTEAFANSTNAPTVLNGPTAQVIIAAAETTAAGDGGELIVVWADAAGDEWYSLAAHIKVKAADLPSAVEVVAAIEADPPAVNLTLWQGEAPNALSAGDVPANVANVVNANMRTIGDYVTLPYGTISGHAGSVLSTNISFNALATGYEGWMAVFGYAESGFPFRVGLWTTKVVSVATNGDVTVEDMPSGSFTTAGKYITLMPFGVSGGTTITAQEVRDAMKLAPTAGDPDAGSVDKHLDDILADTGTTLPAAIAVIDANVDELLAIDTSTTDATTASAISRKRGNTWSISLTLGAITGYTSLWFTIKSSYDDADTAALVQVKKNASGLTDGLLYVNGAAATDATKASITVSDATTGAIVVAVDETITDDLVPGSYYYDVQALISGAVTTPDSGTFTVTADVTRSVM